MMQLERRTWLEMEVRNKKRIDVENVSKKLNVSSMTIRRDLIELENEGKLIRTHGGAVSLDTLTGEVPYSSKKTKNNEKKKAIALKALSLIEKNSTIIMDSGTTTLELAKLLKSREDLTIVTNDIKIGNELIDSSPRVIMTGGELQPGIGALYGAITQSMLASINADIFFLGAHALDLRTGVSAPTFEKALIKQLMKSSAERTWLLADYSKFNARSFVNVCNLSEIQGVITDEDLDSQTKEEYEKVIHFL
ncbi:DeoR/GlpR family DNA-binding transcription regulator [Sporosarcina aquimarina]|uniref:DeoR/GlpR family DNA-binding transcription regulator n=1 Tax=Sporosarcina aquimarina TaxID=114975 RepID=A0ABU4G2F6_9BACL|nr:DeoR/GlpR family DNA-binding transcription regulator [Sporosarcina aquimarina]MDW0111148.1 DeoR/GlpR family DNA-binding transcription regulator [Sporosarcina aquimarina]